MSIPLHHYLKPLTPYLEQDGVTEVCINKPGEIWVEQHGHFSVYQHEELTLGHLEHLSLLVAESYGQEISEEKPLLSAVLPTGLRCQFVIPPACERGSFVCAIRRQNIANLTLDDYQNKGAFKQTVSSKAQHDNINYTKNNKKNSVQARLIQHYEKKEYVEFIRLAIKAKKNMIISGGTSTGKTTFLNACLSEIPQEERIVTIEDVREVKPIQKNTVHLLASKRREEGAKITMLDLLEATLRLRPDRIFLSEITGVEAFPFLRAINTGHPGSLSTVHADTPKGCFEQLVFMVMQSGTALSRQDILTYIQSIVDVVVQIERDENKHRFIAEVYYKDAR